MSQFLEFILYCVVLNVAAMIMHKACKIDRVEAMAAVGLGVIAALIVGLI